MEINQYPLESFTFQDNDYYDIDFWTGSGYQTKKIKGSTIKAGIAAAVETIYNADGSLNGNRSVDLDGKNLNFSDNIGSSTITNEINDGSDYTTLVQDISALVLQAISGGYNSFANVQGAQINMESNDGGSNWSSMVYQAFYTEWLKQNGIQYTKIRQESGQLLIEYGNGPLTKSLKIDSGGLFVNGSYYLPNSDGTLNQILTTDGTGNTSWQDAPATVVSWGDIVGTLSDQTDLQTALDGKFDDPAGLPSQYVRGDGSLADFPAPVGAGSSVSFYLNGGTSQGTILGGQYYQLSQNANLGTNADFTLNADGLIAQFITDNAEPKRTLIPAGNWNTQFYFSASSGGGTPTFYVEVHKYDGVAFTLLGTSSGSPETISGGTSIDLYYTAVAIPETILDIDDRIAIRVYITHDGRTITLHTQASHLSEVVTTFSTGIATLNGLTDQVQYFAIGSTGTNFNITSSGDTHTFNIPISSASNTGLLNSTDYTSFSGKQDAITLTTTGTSGAATFIGNTLNVPNYSGTDTNIYNTDGSLNAVRTVTVTGYRVNFTGVDGTTTMTHTISAASGSGQRYIKSSYVNGTTLIQNAVASSGASLSASSPSGNFDITASTSGIGINGAYYLPNTDGTSGQYMRTSGSGVVSWASLPAEVQVAASDEISALTVGTGKTTFRMPHNMTLTGVRASLTTAQTSGTIFTVDIIYNGVSVLATKLTIDNTEKTSTTAAIPAVITTSALADDGEIRIDITQIGDGTAKGLKVTLLGTRS